MRDHAGKSANGTKDNEESNEIRKYVKNESHNFHEDEFIRGSHRRPGNEYYRDSLVNIEDQVATSKLVLQLVTDSRFNMTQINGQRKLGGPPPGWKGPAPGPGCEVFVGKIPRTLYEHEIYPIFRRMGEVYEIRLMMDFSGTNRGYCFVMFGKPEFAEKAINELDNFEIKPGRRIGVVASINNCRLYIGQLPPDINSEIVIRKIYDITDDVGQVSVYRNANDQARYALISYKTHRGAAMARRRLVPDRAALFGGTEVSIDWAHPSMYPSNVVEDTGICDDDGNIEISRLVIGSENKRYQNRRRARDDFLDHSIRAYLQADRGLDQSSQNKQNFSQNQGSNNSLDIIAQGFNNLHVFDQNLVPNSQSYYQHHNSKPRKDRCQIETLRKSRESNQRESSFDLNVGSGSSESSGCSSQSSGSEKNQNVSREFSDQSLNNFGPSSYHSEIIYSVNDSEEQNFSEQVKISGQTLNEKVGKNDLHSLNLFDNYTFSVNCRETENQGDLNDVQDTGDDLSTIFDNEVEKNHGEEAIKLGENFVPKICNDSQIKRDQENDEKLWEDRNKKMNSGHFLNNHGENFLNVHDSQNSMRYNSSSSNLENVETFPKTICVPIQNEHYKSYDNPENWKNIEFLRNQKDSNLISNPGSPMNLHLYRENKDRHRSQFNRDWESVHQILLPSPNPPQFSNLSCSQNRHGISSLVWNKNNKNTASCAARMVTENLPMQQHRQLHWENGANRSAYSCPKIGNSSNSRNFHSNINPNSKKAWLSAQLVLNGYDYSSSSLENNAIHKLAVYPNSIISRDQSVRRTSTSGFIPQDNSQLKNFNPGRSFPNLTKSNYNCCQNKKIFNAQNGPKTGRPILSRFHANRLCNDN